jgi:hypothetical protein
MLEQLFMNWYRRQIARWQLLEQVRAGSLPARDRNEHRERIAERRSVRGRFFGG